MTGVPLFFYLSELKYRLVYFLISFFLIFVTAYFYAEVIFYLLANPLLNISKSQSLSFISTHVSEIFLSYLKLAGFIAVICSFIVFLSHIYIFFTPGLYKHEKNYLFYIILVSVFLFIFSFFCTYYYLIPIIWKFFLSFQFISSELDLNLNPRIFEYINITLNLLLLFSFSFQLPLILKLLLDFKLISLNFLVKKRHFFILFSFIISGIITPPDVYSQFVLAIISLLLFEITIFFKLLSNSMNKF